MRKSFKYRLFTNKTQEVKLDQLLESARFLYNCALEHRIVNWKQWRKSINFYDQDRSLGEIRSIDKNLEQLNRGVCRNALKRLNRSFQNYFLRLKRGEKSGFPRFKSKDRFHSITFPYYGNGIKITNNKLYIQNVGNIRIKFHRELQGIIKTVTIKRQNNHFYASFSCKGVPENILPVSKKEIGIDVGIESFAVMSDGQTVDNPKHIKNNEDKIKQAQAQYSKKCTAKAKKIFTRLHSHISNQRKDFLHKLSRQIVNQYGYIFIEDLKPSEMLKDNYRTLNRYINDAAWSQFFDYLTYKAEEAGRVVIKVNPKNTTQACSQCGQIMPKELGDRIHVCPHCGFKTTRDHNAALNILRLGRSLCNMQEAVNYG